MMFADAVQAYLADHQASRRNPKHRYQWRAPITSRQRSMGGVEPAGNDASLSTVLVYRAVALATGPLAGT